MKKLPVRRMHTFNFLHRLGQRQSSTNIHHTRTQKAKPREPERVSFSQKNCKSSEIPNNLKYHW